MQERYFVETASGERFGPADLTMLKEWVAQSRLGAATTLVREGTEERVRADSIPGLFAGVVDGPPPVVGPTPGPVSPTGPATAPAGHAPVVRAKNNSALIVAIVLGSLCLCSVPILGAILFPVFAQAKHAAERTKGLSAMKRLGTGVLIYAGDFDDHFPPSMASGAALRPTLGPYVQETALLNSLNPEGGEILGDARMNGRLMANLVDPAQSVMLYDSLPWSGGKAPVCRADGSAKIVPHASIAILMTPDPFGGLSRDEERRQESSETAP